MLQGVFVVTTLVICGTGQLLGSRQHWLALVQSQSDAIISAYKLPVHGCHTDQSDSLVCIWVHEFWTLLGTCVQKRSTCIPVCVDKHFIFTFTFTFTLRVLALYFLSGYRWARHHSGHANITQWDFCEHVWSLALWSPTTSVSHGICQFYFMITYSWWIIISMQYQIY